MKKTNIEVEGGEIILQSDEGHYAIIPAKHRQEVMDMANQGCDDCINDYIQSLPKDSDYAEDGSLIPDWNKIYNNTSIKDNIPSFDTHDILNKGSDKKDIIIDSDNKESTSFTSKIKDSVLNAKDWVSGNIDEHITTPARKAIIPGFDESLKAQRNKYDNSENKLPNFSDYKNPDVFKNIRNFENLSREQIEPTLFNNFSQSVRNRNASAIYPMGYDFRQSPKEYAKSFVSPEATTTENLSEYGQRAENGDSRAQRRIDATLLYAGMPQRYDTFTLSEHSAGKEPSFDFKDKYLKYKLFKESASKTDLYRKLKEEEITYDFLNSEDYKNIDKGSKPNKHGFRDYTGNVMWNATYGIGYNEEKEPYLSYYDRWDLIHENAPELIGKAYDVYSRFKIDEQTIKDFSMYKYTPDKNDPTLPEKDIIDNVKSIIYKAYKENNVEEVLNKLKNSDTDTYRKELGFSKEFINHLKEKGLSDIEVDEFIEREAQRLISFLTLD